MTNMTGYTVGTGEEDEIQVFHVACQTKVSEFSVSDLQSLNIAVAHHATSCSKHGKGDG